MCRLICAKDESLSFFARQHVHFSLLFNVCFNVMPLTERIGFDKTHFTPEMIEIGETSYEQRLGAVFLEFSPKLYVHIF
jgi:hypothetical protein